MHTCMSMYRHVHIHADACRGQKRVPGSREQELQAVMSHQMWLVGSSAETVNTV